MASSASGLRPLERRRALATGSILVGLAGLAWTLTVRQGLDMSGMVSGFGQVGSRMAFDLTAPLLFMGMWLTMIVAMMFPAITPMVLAHRMVVRQRGEGVRSTIAFLLGYLAVWTLIGLVPLAALLVVGRIEAVRPGWLPVLSGGILILAGLYQFTPLKAICLRACRGPIAFLLSHDFSSGSLGALLAGLSHGAYCLGCCWALMSVLVVVGLMNLVWMAALALLFLAEKTLRRGPQLGRVVGTLIVLVGAAVIVHPDLLTHIGNG